MNENELLQTPVELISMANEPQYASLYFFEFASCGKTANAAAQKNSDTSVNNLDEFGNLAVTTYSVASLRVIFTAMERFFRGIVYTRRKVGRNVISCVQTQCLQEAFACQQQ